MNVLNSFADASGGKAWLVSGGSTENRGNEIQDALDEIAAELRNQYSIGFVPKVRKTDGKLHKLRVEVPNLDVNHDGKPDKLKVRHKKGYYAPKS